MNLLKKSLCFLALLSMVGCSNGKNTTVESSSAIESTAQSTSSMESLESTSGGFTIPTETVYDKETQTYTIPFVEGDKRFAAVFTLTGTIQTGWASGTLVVQIFGEDGKQVQKMEHTNTLLYYGTGDFTPADFFWVEDLDFDGFKDVAYALSADERDKYFAGYLWDSSLSLFRQSDFNEIPNPSINTEKKEILGGTLLGEDKGNFSVWKYTDGRFQKTALLSWESVPGAAGVEKITDTRYSGSIVTEAFSVELRTDEDAQKFRSYFATSTQWSNRFNSDGFVTYYLDTAKAATSSEATAASSKNATSSIASTLQGRP